MKDHLGDQLFPETLYIVKFLLTNAILEKMEEG